MERQREGMKGEAYSELSLPQEDLGSLLAEVNGCLWQDAEKLCADGQSELEGSGGVVSQRRTEKLLWKQINCAAEMTDRETERETDSVKERERDRLTETRGQEQSKRENERKKAQREGKAFREGEREPHSESQRERKGLCSVIDLKRWEGR
ncbi:hypothetical protein EYF80_000461 [Liparis tanakae]|uniref:Uncharacterized protein n=1 Tax=Liparis tanakae TaxID=230148 RepID=A0A4Z2JH43_9TELE|nr:hypothetical protein EYF80_000461 [Liparis tanakae]